MAKKQEKRTDMLAQAEEITGIHYQIIIHSLYKGTGCSWNEIDAIVYSYEFGRKIPQRVNDFAKFLLQEWKKDMAQKP